VYSVAFSPNGTLLASGSADHTIRLWDVASGQPRGAPSGHTNDVLSVAFSPNSTLLASGSEDHTIRLRDVAIGQPLGAPLTGHTNYVQSVAFGPNGKLLASGSRDHTIRLWDLDVASWIRRACRIANRDLTRQEWRQYFGDEPYHRTCPGAPATS
jgi:WD40 repeat protein